MIAVKHPNLPQSAVTVAAVSGCCPEIVQGLRQQGIEPLAVWPARTLPSPVSSHADLQLLHLGGSKVLLAQEASSLQEPLEQYGFLTSFLSCPLGNVYPQDISLNFLILKNYCFGLSRVMPLQLQRHCIEANLQVMTSWQGYARCSVAVVSSNGVITADHKLAQSLTDVGFDVLLIPPGEIQLPGYDMGFIGGCCGLIDKDRLAFTGNLAHHSWGDAILAFLEKHRVTPIYLRQEPLLDIGGILPLCEAGTTITE